MSLARAWGGLSGAKSKNDRAPAAGINYYWLKQVDKNRKAQYSNVVAVNWEALEKLTLALSPQPMQASMRVKIKGEVIKCSFVIYHLNGAQIRLFKVNTLGGNTVVQVNRNNLAAGNHFYKLLPAPGELLNGGKRVSGNPYLRTLYQKPGVCFF